MCETFAKALVAVHDADRELPMVPIAWLLAIARNELTDSVRRGPCRGRHPGIGWRCSRWSCQTVT